MAPNYGSVNEIAMKLTTAGRRCSGLVTAALGVFTVALSAPAFSQVGGQNGADDVIHYAYAALFGTGVYRLDDRTVTVLRVPISYRFRDAERGHPGIRALLPVTFGSHSFDFDTIIGDLDVDLSTVSFVPGIEFNFALSPDWTVTTLASFGYGRDLDNNVSSQIYGAAVSSSYTFGKSRHEYRFGTQILVAGYQPSGRSDRVLARIGLGVDAKMPTTWRWGESPVFLNPQLITYFYTREVEFRTLSQERDFFDLRSEIQVGLAVGREQPWKFLGLKFDRVGLGYRYSDNVRGIKLFTRFPF